MANYGGRVLSDYLRFPIGRDCEVIIQFFGPVTQEAIDLLLKTIELSRDCFPKAEEPKPFDLDPSRPTPEAVGGVSVPDGRIPHMESEQPA